MTPDRFFAAVEDRQIATSASLTSLLGANVRRLTPDEAEAALANHAYERRGLRSDGYCQSCGAIVERTSQYSRTHYCPTCRQEKRRETYRKAEKRKREVA